MNVSQFLSKFDGATRLILIIVTAILLLFSFYILTVKETKFKKSFGEVLGIRTVNEKTGRFSREDFYYLDLTNGNSYEVGLIKDHPNFTDLIKSSDSITLYKHPITDEIWQLNKGEDVMIHQSDIYNKYMIIIFTLFFIFIILLFLPIIKKKFFLDS